MFAAAERLMATVLSVCRYSGYGAWLFLTSQFVATCFPVGADGLLGVTSPSPVFLFFSLPSAAAREMVAKVLQQV